jgi:RNA polymerase sigma factor (sigma-70 family)
MSEAIVSPFSSTFSPSLPAPLRSLLSGKVKGVGGVGLGKWETNVSTARLRAGERPNAVTNAVTVDSASAVAPWQDAVGGAKEKEVSHSRLSSGAKPASWGEKLMREDATQIDGGGHAEDERLVAGAQKGDASAFDQLVGRHTARLYGLVYHMTGNHEDTNDLLQDVWTKVFRSLAGFRGASRFTTWIHSIAVNMTINFLKRRSRRQTVSLDASAEEGGASDALENMLISPHTPRTQAGIAELQERLTEALGRLSAEHRAVVTMFDIQGMAHAEIGKILGVSEGTVRSRLFYAHRQLQGFLSDLHMEGAAI